MHPLPKGPPKIQGHLPKCNRRRPSGPPGETTIKQALTRLLVNIDHVATLRNARKETFPDPVAAARLCEEAGAAGIVFHLRQDRRHIRDADVAALASTVKGKLDFELSLAPEIVDICCKTRPQLATIVPERREEVTTEGGLDVPANRDRLLETVPRLFESGIPEVALFLDPLPAQVEAAAEVGANVIEFHTGQYANAGSAERRREVLLALAESARLAHELGIHVHAGHGLDTANYPDFGRTVPFVEEVSVGFAIVARALAVGLPIAVREMIDTINASGFAEAGTNG